MSSPSERDPVLGSEARRLALSAALTRYTLTKLGNEPLPVDSDIHKLGEMARILSGDTGALEQSHRIRFKPSFPGVVAGSRTSHPEPRLLLACTAIDGDDKPLGVVFTALIPRRRPQVSVGPVGTPIKGTAHNVP